MYMKDSALKDGYLNNEKRKCLGCNLKDSWEWWTLKPFFTLRKDFFCSFPFSFLLAAAARGGGVLYISVQFFNIYFDW